MISDLSVDLTTKDNIQSGSSFHLNFYFNGGNMVEGIFTNNQIGRFKMIRLVSCHKIC